MPHNAIASNNAKDQHTSRRTCGAKEKHETAYSRPKRAELLAEHIGSEEINIKLVGKTFETMEWASAARGIFALLFAVAHTYAGEITLNILHVNDHHSYIEEYASSLVTSSLPLSNTTIKAVDIKYGGYPRIAQYLKTTTLPNVLKLHAGDALTGTLWYTLFKGDADARMMGYACFDAFELGNHEFDSGDALLAGFLQNLTAYTAYCPRGSTKLLAANVVPGDTSPLKNQTLLTKSAIFNIGDENVGVVGICIRNKTMGSSRPSPGTILTDEKDAAQAEINALNDAGVNKIVLLSHIGYDFDMLLAPLLDFVDVIVGGDSHSLLGDSSKTKNITITQPDAGYPKELTNKQGKKVCIVTAWQYANIVGRLEVKFTDTGDVESCRGGPVFLINEVANWIGKTGTSSTSVTVPLSVEDKAKVAQSLDANYYVQTVQNPDALQWIMENKLVIESLKKALVANFSSVFCNVRIPGDSRSTECTSCRSYQKGGTACNLVAKAFLMNEKTADMAIQNGGGCRADIKAGPYSIANANTMLPFTNVMVTVKLTGNQIISTLEDAVDSATKPTAPTTGSYPYCAGLRFNVDVSMPKGSRISMVQVNPRLAGSWNAIDEAKIYTVVTNDFVAAGQDGYTTLGAISANLKMNTFTFYAQSFIDYLRTTNGPIASLPDAEYSTRSFKNSDGCDHGACGACGGRTGDQICTGDFTDPKCPPPKSTTTTTTTTVPILSATERAVAPKVVSKLSLDRELTSSEQTSTMSGYASAAGVPIENVEMSAMSKDTRRQSKVSYAVTVYVKDAAAAEAVKAKLLDPAVIKSALIAAGLPASIASTATITAPTVVSAPTTSAPVLTTTSAPILTSATNCASIPSKVLWVVLCAVTLVGSSLGMSK